MIPTANTDDDALADILKRLGRGETVPPLEPKRYRLARPHTLGPAMGATLRGAGYTRSTSPGWEPVTSATVLEYVGPPTQAILTCRGTGALTLDALTFAASPNATTALQVSAHWGSLNITLRDIAFHGPHDGATFGNEPKESTCANVTYEHCHWLRCRNCIRLVNLQSLIHYVINPIFAWSHTAIRQERGGSVHIKGGGTYRLDTLLQLGTVQVNTQGFTVDGIRFDGTPTRTCWLDYDQPASGRNAGNVAFRNCSQPVNQRTHDKPVFRICPGARVIVSGCNFNPHEQYLRRQLAELHSTSSQHSELILEYCHGLAPEHLADYATSIGQNSRVVYRDCGNLRSASRTIHQRTATTCETHIP